MGTIGLLRGLVPGVTRAVPGQFGACNGFRGVGAVMIAAGHFGVLMRLTLFKHIEVITFLVDMFFVFSGLVMMHAYGAKLATPRAAGEFLIRRIGRLWPLQIATLAALVLWECLKLVLLRGGGQVTNMPFDPQGLNAASAILPNVLLLNAVGLVGHESWNFPSWTLGAELVAYCVFATVCVAAFRWRIVIALVIVPAAIAILMAFAPRGMRTTWDFGAVRCVAGFFVGVLVYETLALRPNMRVATATLIEIVALIGLSAFMWFASDTVWAFAGPLLLGVFVWVVALEQGVLTRFVFARPFQIIAEWSFSIYMVHAIVLLGFISAMRFGGRAFGAQWLTADPTGAVSVGPFADLSARIVNLGPAASWAVLLIYLATVLAVSSVTYRYIEVPGRIAFAKLARKFAGRSTPVRQQAASGVAAE